MKVEPKHEYRAPKLIVYGDLSQITNALRLPARRTTTAAAKASQADPAA